jgi:hypothetical protein
LNREIVPQDFNPAPDSKLKEEVKIKPLASPTYGFENKLEMLDYYPATFPCNVGYDTSYFASKELVIDPALFPKYAV